MASCSRLLSRVTSTPYVSITGVPPIYGIHYYVTGFEKPGFHTHNIKLTFSPEMDYWLNTLSYSTAGLAPKPRVWFL